MRFNGIGTARSWVLSALIAAPVAALPASAGAAQVYLDTSSGGFSVHVMSMREMRYRTVVVQHYDYSCGAAAVATLLTYSYDRPTPEAGPFLQMIRHGDRAKIEKLGFSMLDMRNYLDHQGFNALGIRVSLHQLRQLRVPGIALIQVNGYKHFVVVRAVNDNEVLFADPARGMQIMSRARFNKIWDNVLLVIRNDVEKGRAGFNEQAFLKVRPAAPVASVLDQIRPGISIYTEGLATRNLF